MLTGICTIHDIPRDTNRDQLAASGVHLIRADLTGPDGWSELWVRDLLAETRSAPWRLLVTLPDPLSADDAAAKARRVLTLALDVGLPWGRLWGIEIGNEPDVASHSRWYDNPVGYAACCRSAHEALVGAGYDGEVISGGISTLDQRGRDYLAAMDWSSLPEGLVVGIHRYAPLMDPATVFSGFATRGQEVDAIRDIVGGRRLAHTEGGYHTAPFSVRTGLWKSEDRQLTDDEAALALIRELEFWCGAGVLCFCAYQWNDGPGVSDLDRFGLRSADGELKPQAEAIQEWIAATRQQTHYHVPVFNARTGRPIKGATGTLEPDDQSGVVPARVLGPGFLAFTISFPSTLLGWGAWLRITAPGYHEAARRLVLGLSETGHPIDIAGAQLEPATLPGTRPFVKLSTLDVERIARSAPGLTYGTAGQVQAQILDALVELGDRRWGRHVDGSTGNRPVDILASAEPDTAEGHPHTIYDFIKGSTAQPPSPPPELTFRYERLQRPGSRWEPWDTPRLAIAGTTFTHKGQKVKLAGFTSFDLGTRSRAEAEAWVDLLAKACQGLPRDVVPFLRVVYASVHRTHRSLSVGRFQMPAVMQLAASRGFYVELCSADSAKYGLSRSAIKAEVSALVDICRDWPNAFLGGENEIGGGGVSGHYDDAGFRRELAALVAPSSIPLCVGSSHGGREDAYAEGDFIADHAHRKNTVEQNAPLMAAKQARYGKPLLDEEPEGVAEEDRGESRTNDPERGFKQARLCQEHGYAGSLLHLDAGLEAKVSQLGPVQKKAVQRFVEGWHSRGDTLSGGGVT